MDLTRYLKENMVLILEGQELIRDFVDPVKWLSSDYKMSIPGIKKEKIVKQELVMIQSFLLLKTPVTNELYNYVMETDYDIQTKNFPAVNISWIDAIKFCNLLSEKLSLEKCYTLNSASEKLYLIIPKMALDYQKMKNGNMLVEEIQKDIDMTILKILLGSKKIRMVDYMK